MSNPNAGKHSGAFKKGQSGNPGGKPKYVKEVRRIAGEQSAETINRLIEIRDDPSYEVRGRIEACKIILAYGVGKPVQQVHKVVEHVKRSPRDMSLEDLQRYLERPEEPTAH